jgi:hypothetical protein
MSLSDLEFKENSSTSTEIGNFEEYGKALKAPYHPSEIESMLYFNKP